MCVGVGVSGWVSVLAAKKAVLSSLGPHRIDTLINFAGIGLGCVCVCVCRCV